MSNLDKKQPMNKMPGKDTDTTFNKNKTSLNTPAGGAQRQTGGITQKTGGGLGQKTGGGITQKTPGSDVDHTKTNPWERNK